MDGGRRTITTALFAPCDVASLVFFRIAFGLLLAWEIGCYFRYGWIDDQLLRPALHFTYYGFGWVRPWAPVAMYAHVAALGVLALMIAAGACYRVAATLFFVGFSYLFLIDQAYYLNHFYLVCLLSFLLILLPAHRAFSVDALLLRPAIAARTAPVWSLWLLRAQIAIVYFYAGLAKLNGDWLAGRPMDMWLATRTDLVPWGPLLGHPWMPHLFSYGGLLLDLFVVPLLLWRRTRAHAFAMTIVFHVMNAWMFEIGIFPWLMIAATSLFLRPDWPRRLLLRDREPVESPAERQPREPAAPTRRLIASAVAVYLTVQAVVPLRHHLYPGSVHWTEEGHRFAWHMKLRSKHAEQASFHVAYTGRDGQRGAWTVKPGQYLAPWQIHTMVVRPDMVLQLAHFVAASLERNGFEHVEVKATIHASLNGRPSQPLVDPEVDLAAQRRTLAPAAWIVPLGASAEMAMR